MYFGSQSASTILDSLLLRITQPFQQSLWLFKNVYLIRFVQFACSFQAVYNRMHACTTSMHFNRIISSKLNYWSNYHITIKSFAIRLLKQLQSHHHCIQVEMSALVICALFTLNLIVAKIKTCKYYMHASIWNKTLKLRVKKQVNFFNIDSPWSFYEQKWAILHY